MTATTELVVPRSMPITFPMLSSLHRPPAPIQAPEPARLSESFASRRGRRVRYPADSKTDAMLRALVSSGNCLLATCGAPSPGENAPVSLVPHRHGRPGCSSPSHDCRRVKSHPRSWVPAVTSPALPTGRREVLVNELDSRRPFANAGGDTLHGSAPHVAGREYARHARLEPVGLPLERPVARASRCPVPRFVVEPGEVGPGHDIAAAVPFHDAVEPFRVRFGADENEERGRGQRVFLPGRRVADGDRFEPRVALDVDDDGLETHADIARRLDLIDE